MEGSGKGIHRAKALLGTLLWMTLGFLPATAGAYTTTGAYWSGSWPVVPYYINAASFPTSVGTQQQIIDAIRKGANHWNFETHGKVTLQYMGTSTLTTRSANGTNVVYYDPNNCDSSAGACIAQIQWWPATGALTDFDITFHGKDSNGTTINWDAVDPILFTTDLWGHAAHEFGHALGLGHSTVTVATMNATVGGSATWQRFLTSDDISGAQSLYGVNTDIAASNLNPTAGTNVTISLDFPASSGDTYIFYSTLNGTSPGYDLSQSDPFDYRFMMLNQSWVPMETYPYIFENIVGTLGVRGGGSMIYHTTGLSGICLDYAGIVLETGWPNGVRHVTDPIHICVQ